LWFSSAAIAWWLARRARTKRSRRRIHAIVVLALVIGGENLVQALVVHHPQSAAHFVANLALAVTGLAAFVVAALYGRDVLTDDLVLFALSHGQLGIDNGRRNEARPESLTPRECDVIGCLCEGLRTDEIAERLSISPQTATTHVRNIMRKLSVSSRADAIAWAVRHGMADRN
jgi:DNA-binding CsgD family transcriptional regulator